MEAKYVAEDPLVQVMMTKAQANTLKKFFIYTGVENIGEVIKASTYNDKDTRREIDDAVDELYDVLKDLAWEGG